MSVDFRFVNKLHNISLEELAKDFPLFSVGHLKQYLNQLFQPKDIHIYPYCPKPNEPDDAIWVNKPSN